MRDKAIISSSFTIVTIIVRQQTHKVQMETFDDLPVDLYSYCMSVYCMKARAGWIQLGSVLWGSRDSKSDAMAPVQHDPFTVIPCVKEEGLREEQGDELKGKWLGRKGKKERETR